VAHVPPGARRVRLGDKPAVSVVVASCRDADALAACLASLERQCRDHQAEIVVARGVQGSEGDWLRQRYPAVRWVTAGYPADIAQLRALGLSEARGDIVALTEDHDVVSPDWLSQRLRGGSSLNHQAGAADDRRTPAVDWAAYFAKPEPRGDPPAQPGSPGFAPPS
jgi:hypothetical protein